jgi:hypothetical protein
MITVRLLSPNDIVEKEGLHRLKTVKDERTACYDHLIGIDPRFPNSPDLQDIPK